MDNVKLIAEYNQRKEDFEGKEETFESLSVEAEPQERQEKLRDWIEAALSYWEIYVKIEYQEMGVFERVYKTVYNQSLKLAKDSVLTAQPRIPNYDRPIQGLQEIATLIDKGINKPKSPSKKKVKRKSAITPKQRKAWEMIHLRHITQKQAAMELGCSSQNVSKLLKIAEEKIAAETSRSVDIGRARRTDRQL